MLPPSVIRLRGVTTAQTPAGRPPSTPVPTVTDPHSIHNAVFNAYPNNNDAGRQVRRREQVQRQLNFKAGLRYAETDVDVRAVSYYARGQPGAESGDPEPTLSGGDRYDISRWNFGMNAQPVQNPAASSPAIHFPFLRSISARHRYPAPSSDRPRRPGPGPSMPPTATPTGKKPQRFMDKWTQPDRSWASRRRQCRCEW